ncbi:hypothetical protein [Streptomyces telluris]|uniref:Uncharacterized protein n=1 Tax=Streptomyces telluris TaxID=2720021 RepID=A0A9X2RQ25_9ACTN|nr:hypothetical protein [Streptomyces telluris]MCQ8772051.1 hypothetical protein [Streptomyces telluris]NJP78835.1 hypothetical protein [Streptomyces telluris]
MAFHITQGNPIPQVLQPGANASFAIEVYVDGNPVGPGEIIQVKLPDGLVFPPTGEIRYMNLDSGINRPLPIESRDPDGRLVRFKAEAIGNKPEGFYSVNVQALPNAAPGDRTVTDGLTIGATAAKLSFRVGAAQPVEQRVYGIVGADGAVVVGSGFTVKLTPNSTSTSIFTITFAKPFTTAPVVVATATQASPSVSVTIGGVTPNTVTICTASPVGTWKPLPFHFIAMGPAQP